MVTVMRFMLFEFFDYTCFNVTSPDCALCISRLTPTAAACVTSLPRTLVALLTRLPTAPLLPHVGGAPFALGNHRPLSTSYPSAHLACSGSRPRP